MSDPRTFGRRRPAADPLPAPRRPEGATAAPFPPPPPPASDELPPAAEALRAEIAAARRSGGGDFADWRRSRQGARVLAWVMTLLLLSPGLFCFLYNAPAGVSLGVEVCGIAANAWLRRARRQHLKAITGWSAPSEEG